MGGGAKGQNSFRDMSFIQILVAMGIKQSQVLLTREL